MSKELLDLVDENNNLTGEKAERKIVHSSGLWHRTVHIYIFRKKGGAIEFLLHFRSPDKDMAPNCWDTRFGGHIKSGFSIEEGVKSELAEEIGLDIKSGQLIEGEWRESDKFPNREFSKIFFLEYDGNLSDLKFNDGEVQEIRWMSIQDIKNAIADKPERWAAGLSSFNDASNSLINKL